MSILIRRRSTRRRASSAVGSGYPTAVLASSPAAYWRLNEAGGVTSYADATGNGHAGTGNGTVTNGAASAQPGLGTAISLAGAGAVVATTLGGLGAAMSAGTTIELLIRTTTTAATCALGSLNTGGTTGVQLELNRDATDASSIGSTSLWVRAENGGIRQLGIASPAVYSGSWCHLVFVWSATGTVAAYVNGSPVTVTDSTRFGPLTATANFGFPMVLGGRNNRGTVDSRVSGDLDEVALYSSQLSAATVAAHYAALTA